MGSAQRRTRSVEQAKEDVKRGFTPALVLGGAVLPAVLFTNWRFVPAPYQLHCVSLFALIGSCSLSCIELEQHTDDAAGPEGGRSNKVCSDDCF
jgi:hypothetical protein